LRTGQSGARLAAEIEVFRIRMLQTEARLNFAKLETAPYGFAELFRLLDKSDDALQSANLELAWSAFNTARYLETQIYYQLSQHKDFKEFASMFHAKAVAIYAESNNKLQGWRRQAVNALLGGNNQAKEVITLGELLQAEQTLYEHHSNIYRRLNIIKRQFIWLALIAILALASWVVFLLFQCKLCQNTLLVYDLSLTIQSVIFGILGACTSGILTLANSSTRQNIPEKLLTAWVTFARPLVGAVSALAVVVFALVGILEIGDKSPGLYLAAAFTAGFSERLLIRTIESLVGKADAGDREKDKITTTPTS
ncbi:MAG: hypothetical protein JSV61_08675, partial [Anaerolineales bacterium]